MLRSREKEVILLDRGVLRGSLVTALLTGLCFPWEKKIKLSLIISSAAPFLHINSVIYMIGVGCAPWGCSQQLVKYLTF